MFINLYKGSILIFSIKNHYTSLYITILLFIFNRVFSRLREFKFTLFCAKGPLLVLFQRVTFGDAQKTICGTED